jgi:ankyrin repeat protein
MKILSLPFIMDPWRSWTIFLSLGILPAVLLMLHGLRIQLDVPQMVLILDSIIWWLYFAGIPSGMIVAICVRIIRGTELHYCAASGQQEYARYLVRRFKSFTRRKNFKGCTALHIAADCGRIEVVKALLSSPSAITNIGDRSGKTALHYAVAGNHVEIIRLLLDANAKPDIRDNNGKCPIDYASTSNEVRGLLQGRER